MENTYSNRCEEVLAHHGTKGMHWGIRRYQNPDGSLTAAGRRRMEKSDRKTVKELRKNSQVYDAVSERSGKAAEKSKKKWEKAYTKAVKKGKDTNTKKINKLEEQYALDAAFDKTVKTKQADFRKAANKITNEYISKYGDKKLKSIKTNPDGSIGDKHTGEMIKSALTTAALAPILPLSAPMVAMAGSMSYNRQSVQGRANKIYKDNYKRERERLREESKSERASQKNADKEFRDSSRNVKTEVSKKEQKSNLKELSSLSKSSGFDKAMKKLNNGDSDGFTKEIDRIKEKGMPKSNVINKIAQSKSVSNAQKEHDRTLSEWTKAQKEVSDYIKKNGYPKSDKHSETTKDPVYNRLQAAADKAQEANSRAYDKLQKNIYSEMGKQIGKDPTADNLEAIRYMIELQIK